MTNMISRNEEFARYPWIRMTQARRNSVVNNLLESRDLFAIQTVEYDLKAVSSIDLDPSGNFLLIGLSNGTVDLQGIKDPNYGTLDQVTRLNLSPFNLHRVQWNPGDEQFFSMLDNHNLYLVDPVELRAIERFPFNLKTTWSEWNCNDKKMIAVCGAESQVRLVDIRSGSSVQTIILTAKSGLASHRATRCLWSKQDHNCLIVGDNEGYLHVYDTRNSQKPQLFVGEERGQISGMSFTVDQSSIITSQGTENHLIQWTFDRCSLRPWPSKFKKRNKRPPGESNETISDIDTPMSSNHPMSAVAGTSASSRKQTNKKLSVRKQAKKVIPLPVDAYLRCQFYVTGRHVYCPVPSRVTKSKEIYIYDLETGDRIKTLKSDDILSQGVFSITGLLPDSLVLYVGGRGRLRVWSIDEEYTSRMEERRNKYHKTRWDSDDEMQT